MTLIAMRVALEMIAAIRPVLSVIRQKSPQLADQLERAATSAIAEAWGYISSGQRAPAEAKLDQLAALLWGLTHRD